MFVHPVFRLHKVEVALLCELEFKHQVLLLSQLLLLLLLLLLFFWFFCCWIFGLFVCLFICLSKYRHQHDLLLRFTMYVVIVLSWVCIVQELCESRGGRPGLSVLTSLLVSVDVKNY